jgi:hypothetical protein
MPTGAEARLRAVRQEPCRFIAFWPRRIEHHALCSATGIPHSTQIRVRGFGGAASLSE